LVVLFSTMKFGSIMSSEIRCNKTVVFLFGAALCFCLCPCHGENREEIFDKVLSGYTQSLQKLEHVSFSYQWEETINGMPSDKRAGRIFFDQKNIKDKFVETRTGDAQETQYETVIAPEWGRFIRVARSDQLDPTVVSCLNAENIPGIHRTLGATSFLFGWALFQGGHVYLPEILRSLGPSNVTISDSDRNRKEICFIYQGHQCRMLLDADFTLMLFESTGLHSYEVQEFININEIVFPTKLVTITQMPPSSVIYTYSLSDISFETLSEKDFQFSLPLLNGTPVHMQDARHIEHIWLDGKIVPKTNEAMLAIARGGHKFMPGPEEPRFWLLTISIILILIGGGRLAYRYFVKGENV